MLLNDLVETSATVRATAARTEKVEALASTLVALSPDETGVGVSYLAGVVPQGSIGVGWSTLGEDIPPAAGPSVTISDFGRWLDEVASESGQGSQVRRRRLVDDLFGRLGTPEQEFVRGLLLGNLRQGASEGLMVPAMAAAWSVPIKAVRRALMLTGDLAETADACREGLAALDRIGLTVGKPILPMLAKTASSTADAIVKLGEARIEWKLDGARIQVHKRGDDVTAFTRGLHLADVPDVLHNVRAYPAETLILDGEVIGIGADARPLPFQETMGVFATEGPATMALEARFFDILHIDGTDLIDLPLARRAAFLEGVVPVDHRIPALATGDPALAESFFEQAIAAGHEGVMVKSIDGPYEAGRRGSTWLKIKPVHTLDLVVLAVEWGSGRRAGTLSNIHLGARSDDGFVMLGKTFKGMTDDMLAWQTARFLELETHRSGHVVHVRPEQVVEVAVDGIQTSSRYPGGISLRFARVRRYRSDKTADTADTVDTVRSLLAR